MANGFAVDTATGAPGVQPWSRGAIFPLVIARRERFHPVVYGETMSFASWDVLNADDDMPGFASYDDALEAAKGWLAAQRENAFKARHPRADRMPRTTMLSPFNPAAFDAELAADLYGVS